MKHNWLKENLINFNITRFSRIKRYMKNLENHIKINSKRDKEVLEEINMLVQDRINRIRKLYIINSFLYFAIYFSFISLIFSDLFILSEFAQAFSRILSFFGTTGFIIGVFIVNKMIELYYMDLTLLSAHIISLYNKNHTEQEILFDETNSFNSYIDFFKKRGFK